MDKIRQWLYYFIIGIVSLICVGFIPFLGSSLGLSWAVPDTTTGWIVWGATKAIVCVINVLIFHSFMCQAKLNVKDDPNYLKAREILQDIKEKNVQPRSPKKWNAEQYSKKGITIFIFTALSTVALGQALLTYDWVSAISYIFTIIMGIIFGILQMKSAEEYWTNEYLKYAKQRQKELNEKETENNDHDREERGENRASQSGGAGETKSE